MATTTRSIANTKMTVNFFVAAVASFFLKIRLSGSASGVNQLPNLSCEFTHCGNPRRRSSQRNALWKVAVGDMHLFNKSFDHLCLARRAASVRDAGQFPCCHLPNTLPLLSSLHSFFQLPGCVMKVSSHSLLPYLESVSIPHRSL